MAFISLLKELPKTHSPCQVEPFCSLLRRTAESGHKLKLITEYKGMYNIFNYQIIGTK